MLVAAILGTPYKSLCLETVVRLSYEIRRNASLVPLFHKQGSSYRSMYRPNVCAILFCEDSRVLGCRRVRHTEYQFVQGGIEKKDTDIVTAALREMEEEIGLTAADVTFVAEVPPPSGNPAEFRYTLHEGANLRRFGYVGQEQRMLLFYAPSTVSSKVVLKPPASMKGVLQEFDGVEWMTFEEIVARCRPEKLELFKKLGVLCPPIIEQYVKQLQQAAAKI